jgi:hypothetical protein
MSALVIILYTSDGRGRDSPYLLLFFWLIVQLEHNSKYKIFILRNKLRGVVICGYRGINPVEKWISGWM